MALYNVHTTSPTVQGIEIVQQGSILKVSPDILKAFAPQKRERRAEARLSHLVSKPCRRLDPNSQRINDTQNTGALQHCRG